LQTAFTAAQLEEPAIADAAAILKDCVHYGFCTAVCPTYVLLRDENDAPRGRIDLIRAMLEKGGRPDDKTVLHLDRCLSCNACMTTCAAKVDYMHLADIARAHIERHYRRPLGDRMLRALLARALTNPRAFRIAVQASRLARPFARALPARLRNLVTLAPPALPRPHESIRAGVYPAEGTRRLRAALLTGCVQQALAPGINAATIRLLARHGCEVVVAPANCCGALPLHMGREDQAKAHARALIHAWSEADRQSPLDAIVINASGCGTTVKDYARIFRHDTDVAPAARSVAQRALDVSELMIRLGIAAPAQPVPLAVAYHDACSLQHAQKVTEPPRQLLRAAGFRVLDVPERHFCCGSAGTYNLLQPAIAAELGLRKARHIESTEPDVIAAGNLGCITQIQLYTSKPVVHTVELLDWATGGPRPPGVPAVSAQPLPTTAATEESNAAIW
jgi:glycolate oxidase iron-sulfur subunit